MSKTVALAAGTFSAMLGFTIKGRGKAEREDAFLAIAPLSFVAERSRQDVVTKLQAALGKSPSPNELKGAQREFVIGRVAARLAPADIIKGVDASDPAARLQFARDLVTRYAAPVKDGVAARKLRKGQLGRRTVSQHKAVRAGEESWSQIKADIGLGNAQTQSERNAKKRAPAMKGATARGKGAPAPTHAELVKPAAPVTASDACGHVTLQAAALLAFVNKHAKLLPMAFGVEVKRFHKEIMKADAERRALEGADAN